MDNKIYNISLYLILKQRCFLSHLSLVVEESPIQNPTTETNQPTNKQKATAKANFYLYYTNTVVTSSLKKQQKQTQKTKEKEKAKQYCTFSCLFF